MKLSDLIVKLQKILKDKGDCTVFVDQVYGADIGVTFDAHVRKYFPH